MCINRTELRIIHTRSTLDDLNDVKDGDAGTTRVFQVFDVSALSERFQANITLLSCTK